MKTTQKTVACLTCLLMLTTTLAIAQLPPFGLPPAQVNQAPTPDRTLSGLGNIVLEPLPEGEGEGGGIGGDACPDGIEHTGADMQLTGLGQEVAKVVVWDGCPGFYFSISPNEYSNPTYSVEGEIYGSRFNTVTDPDVILTQNNSNGDVSILIVYQLSVGANRIAFEQWDYNSSTNTLSLNLPASVAPNPYIITSGSGVQHITPNIAGNADDEIAIVYIIETGTTTTMATMLSQFSKTPPTEFNTSTSPYNKEIKFDNCPGTNLISPDVSISDRDTYNSTPIISYVAIKDSDPTNYGGLFLIQQEYSVLTSSPTPIINCYQTSDELDTDCRHPRISSPKESYMSHNKECAVTAEKRATFPPDPLVYQGIKLYHNYGNPISFSNLFLNYNASDHPANKVISGVNEFPAIAYASGGKVSVAWEYDGYGSSDLEVISVNYDMLAMSRTPFSYMYYMLVNQTLPNDQHIVSVAGGSFVSTGNHPIFYAFIGGVGFLRYSKTSNTFSQPYIRKKVSFNEPSETEVLVYPNPTNDLINIDFNNIDIESAVNVRIISIDGKLVYEKTALKDEFNKPLNVSSFDQGIYLIEYSYDDIVEREKVIIQ